MLDRSQLAAIARTLPLLALIACAALLSYRYHRLLIDQRDQVEHTYQVISTLEDTQVRIIDAETGQRGYVITGNDAYLAPYQRALAQLPVLLGALRRLVADSPIQARRVVLLQNALRVKLAELSSTMAVRQQSGLQAARVEMMRDRGRVAMDTVRLQLGELRAAEAGLLARRITAAKRTEERLLATTVACLCMSWLGRLGVAMVQARGVKTARPRRPRRR